jgi:hypothetical protein
MTDPKAPSERAGRLFSAMIEAMRSGNQVALKRTVNALEADGITPEEAAEAQRLLLDHMSKRLGAD